MDLPQPADRFSNNQIFSLVRRWTSTPFSAALLRGMLILIAVSPVGYTTYRQWPEVQNAFSHVHWLPLLVSMALLFLSMSLMGIIPWLTLRSLQVRRPLYKISGFYFISQLTKYLPGGIWAYPTRVVAYQADGIDRVRAVVSVAREVIFLFLGAASVASVAYFVGVPSLPWMQVLVVLGVVGCLLGILVTSSPKVLDLLIKIPLVRSFGYHPEQVHALAGLKPLDSLLSLLASGIYWFGAGFSFLYLVHAVNPSATLRSDQAIALFALAWCVGFVIVILPAGFGVRETAILYLLKSFVPLADAVAVSLLARLCWMVSEAAWTVLLTWTILPCRKAR